MSNPATPILAETNLRDLLDACKLIERLLTLIDRVTDDSEGHYPSPDGGCIECTVGTVPDRLNTGLCAYHAAKGWLKG